MRSLWTRARRTEKAAYLISAALILSGLVHVAVLLTTGRTWEGPLSLRKAATFGLSFGLTLATVTWATSYLTIKRRTPLLALFATASIIEVILVTTQAWRGVPSHFNFETPQDTAVSMTLAAGGGVLVLTSIALTVAATTGARNTTPTMRLAVRFGLAALLIALATGAAMIAKGVIASRSGNPDLAYTTAGSLKPLHAVAMHAILVVPALAWLLDRTTIHNHMRLVWTAIAAYSTLITLVGVESITGVSPLAPPTIAAIASILAITTLGAVTLYGWAHRAKA
ncbi:hypothetical protein V5P93_005857 [Actinokineospora auranticolor]|uniref:Uncharacterized protein n=1 Tax=Actinokineospora auranticolor TaxID=155976 RepID=A0A2S6GJF1_9PSEU|nr:hypothetical protein [Actinokineospora auranticolor]PPK65364.1 hypothetical protein CLV40_11416 [Actinokineospora auranticolor]